MGERGEIFSITTYANGGQKTFFFNIKENRLHDIFMSIAESVRSGDGKQFNRFQILVFEEDFSFFSVMIWQLEELVKNHIFEYDKTLISKNGKRQYKFYLSGKGNSYQPYMLNIKEESTAEEPNEDKVPSKSLAARTIRIPLDDLANFSIGYNRCRAYKEGGNADPNKPYRGNTR